MKTNGNDWLGQIIFNKTKNDDDFLIPEFEKQKTTTIDFKPHDYKTNTDFLWNHDKDIK